MLAMRRRGRFSQGRGTPKMIGFLLAFWFPLNTKKRFPLQQTSHPSLSPFFFGVGGSPDVWRTSKGWADSLAFIAQLILRARPGEQLEKFRRARSIWVGLFLFGGNPPTWQGCFVNSLNKKTSLNRIASRKHTQLLFLHLPVNAIFVCPQNLGQVGERGHSQNDYCASPGRAAQDAAWIEFAHVERLLAGGLGHTCCGLISAACAQDHLLIVDLRPT